MLQSNFSLIRGIKFARKESHHFGIPSLQSSIRKRSLFSEEITGVLAIKPIRSAQKLLNSRQKKSDLRANNFASLPMQTSAQ